MKEVQFKALAVVNAVGRTIGKTGLELLTRGVTAYMVIRLVDNDPTLTVLEKVPSLMF